MSVDVRSNLEHLMRETLADRAHWTYLAVRPQSVPVSWAEGQDVTFDCSKAVQALCRWAHAPDPMGNEWSRFGNSSTLALHLQHLPTASDLLIGDVITFGRFGSKHAAMVLERDTDPLLWSHGHPGAPNLYRLSDDTREHQFLRLPVPRFVPSPEDRLRGRTGYWAWMQWLLAEGDWRGQHRADPDVRPNVPRLIPAQWWMARVRFLAARRKPNDVPC